MTGHYRHVLEMAFPAFVTDGAIMGMVYHKPFNNPGSKLPDIVVIDRNPCSVVRRGHTGHDNVAAGVIFIMELLYRAHPAGPDGAQRWMPTEIRDVEAQGKACAEEILSFRNFIRDIVYINSGQVLSPGTTLLRYVSLKVFSEKFQCALQRLHGSWRKSAKSAAGPEQFCMRFKDLQIIRFATTVFNGLENPCGPRQSFPAGRAPSTGFPGEKAFQVMNHSNRACMIVQRYHCSRAETAPGFLD